MSETLYMRRRRRRRRFALRVRTRESSVVYDKIINTKITQDALKSVRVFKVLKVDTIRKKKKKKKKKIFPESPYMSEFGGL